MTNTIHAAPPTAPSQHLRPFTLDPGRWEAERSHALRTGHVRETGCTEDCDPVLVRERTGWGWLEWTVPADGGLPERPHRIGVLTPGARRSRRLALRWLTRRPARRIGLAPAILGTVRFSTAATAVLSLVAAGIAISNGAVASVVMPLMLLAPLLVEHLPDRLDDRASEHVRTVEGEAACQYLQRLAALHTYLVQAAAGSDRHQVRRAAEIGRHQMWDAASLLINHDTHSVSDQLIAREQLLVQLTALVTQLHTPAGDNAAAPDQPGASTTALGPYPPGASRPHQPPRQDPPNPRQTKGHSVTPRPNPDREQHHCDVYLLFAHEPYHPGPGTQEVNTSLVAAATLLHPRVHQPDGARIHDRLTLGRRPGEIVPLATLTHELGGGADWPQVGDWAAVTEDLVQLIRADGCDALSLGLPGIARALVCTAPHSHVRAYDPTAGQYRAYGPADRVEVLAEIGKHLLWAEAGHTLWPGDGLSAPGQS